MWVTTTGGFVSAVEHRDNPMRVLVRARDRKSLEVLIGNIELAGAEADADGQSVEKITEDDIIEMGEMEADYRYRVEMNKATFALALTFEVLNFVTYDNFKDAVTVTRGDEWHRTLINVWGDMRDIDDKTGVEATGRRRSGRMGSWL